MTGKPLERFRIVTQGEQPGLFRLEILPGRGETATMMGAPLKIGRDDRRGPWGEALTLEWIDAARCCHALRLTKPALAGPRSIIVEMESLGWQNSLPHNRKGTSIFHRFLFAAWHGRVEEIGPGGDGRGRDEAPARSRLARSFTAQILPKSGLVP